MRGLLIGNYGVGNLGDELLKEYFLERFQDVQWTVLSAHPASPQEAARLPAGLRSFLHWAWVGTLGELRRTDVVVFGGGSLFTDVESPFACFLWWLHVRAARLFRKPVLLAFQGIGPFHTRRGEWFARDAVRHAAFLSVRDEESFRRVQFLLKSTKVVRSFDPVFALFLKYSRDRTEYVITIIPRRNSAESFQRFLTQHLHGSSQPVQILSLQPDDPEEQRAVRQLAKLYKARVVAVRDAASLLAALAKSSLVLTERYHGALAALALGKKTGICSQGSGDKLSTLPQGEAAAEWVVAMRQRLAEGEQALLAALSDER